MNLRFAILTLLALQAASCAVKPVARFTVPPKKLVAPAEVEFTNAGLKEGTVYSWDFGDGTTSADPSPKHTYRQSGNYPVTLKATLADKTTVYTQMIQVTAPDRCLIEIETDHGTMLAELFSSTPKHRDNFTKLAEEGYFNDLLFHRVISGFMIQGGDPDSRNARPGQRLGMGGPSYQIPAEFVDSLVHTRGAIAAARNNNPEKKSSGSQFYIVQGSKVTEEKLNEIEAMGRFHYTPEQRQEYLANGGTPQLDRGYTVFGRVIQGLEVIDKIAAAQKGPDDRPAQDGKMKIRVIK